MKTQYKETIDGYTIIRFIADATIDIEASKREGKTVYALIGPEADNIEDDVAIPRMAAFASMGEHQKLLIDGENYIADYRGVEFDIKRSGKWKKEKIEKLGVPLPKGAVLQESLTVEQRAEIAVQREAERVAALTPEKRAEELEAKLDAAARETNLKALDMELRGKAFNKQDVFLQKKQELEAIYA